MEHILNHIELCGTLATAPEYSHENHGRTFYRFFLDVERLSGVLDTLQIVVSQELLSATEVDYGQCIAVTGQIRSFNNRSCVGRKLIISVYAETLEVCDREPCNLVNLTGVICKEPVFRRTPLGREICDIMLAVNRPYHRTDYLPCIFWGRTAEEFSQLSIGTSICLEGRLQSREYVKMLETGSEKRTAYEISAISAEVLQPEYAL
ncbi:MAG: single-stranded DNA-binding protein [Faecousia sp.]|nr:single-stranded DNA-binding protein [Bacillota bacterium]MDY2720278.1 single-stranded DNA-binding protein [Candidatus Faecousia sp.]